MKPDVTKPVRTRRCAVATPVKKVKPSALQLISTTKVGPGELGDDVDLNFMKFVKDDRMDFVLEIKSGKRHKVRWFHGQQREHHAKNLFLYLSKRAPLTNLDVTLQGFS